MMVNIPIEKHLAKSTVSDKILTGKAYEIARNLKYNGYQRALSSILYKFFDMKTGWGVTR